MHNISVGELYFFGERVLDPSLDYLLLLFLALRTFQGFDYYFDSTAIHESVRTA